MTPTCFDLEAAPLDQLAGDGRPILLGRPPAAQDCAEVGDGAEVGELVRVGDPADGLDYAVDDLERHDRGDAALLVHEHHAGLPVELGRRQRPAEPRGLRERADHQLRDALAPVDRLRPGRRLAAAVAVHDDVRGEQLDQRVRVAELRRGEEPPRELVALLARGFEPRPSLVDVALARTYSCRQLSSLRWTIFAISA